MQKLEKRNSKPKKDKNSKFMKLYYELKAKTDEQRLKFQAKDEEIQVKNKEIQAKNEKIQTLDQKYNTLFVQNLQLTQVEKSLKADKEEKSAEIRGLKRKIQEVTDEKEQWKTKIIKFIEDQ